MFRKIRILITTTGIVLGLPLTTFFVVRHEQHAQRAETNARIAAVEKEAAARSTAVAKTSRDADQRTCESNNRFRAADLDTWQSVFNLIDRPSDGERALLARIKKKDSPRDCAAIAKGTR